MSPQTRKTRPNRLSRVNTYRAEQEKSLAETDQQIDLCLRSNNEKLGRSMVRRKLEIQKRIKLSERQRAALEPERDKLTQGLAAKKAKLASVKEKMEIFVEEGRHETAQATRCDRDYGISDDEVEVAFSGREGTAQRRVTRQWIGGRLL